MFKANVELLAMRIKNYDLILAVAQYYFVVSLLAIIFDVYGNDPHFLFFQFQWQIYVLMLSDLIIIFILHTYDFYQCCQLNYLIDYVDLTL